MKKLVLGVGLVALVGSLSGCATIVGDSTQSLQVTSSPTDAAFLVKDEKGEIVARGVTPQTVMLEKNDGSYFGKKSYLVTICKPGYAAATVPLKETVSGWYSVGNFFTAPLIGYLAIDPFHGGMYNIEPPAVNGIMTKRAGGACDPAMQS
ncbi:hypothetical protein [Lelliottia nimipressuralis]|uniref:Lipoprotein n=1 Tax=Lelliottia nimipressuralis TaxID=69220 RepID=A0ABD4KH52_9ENTR|nr:hypothetical protein [Lelliottia nimipressuralis]MBF4180403.1 hypothetical protein [Lelliottia nimipressuralis]